MILLITRLVSVLWSLALLTVLCLSLPLAFAVGRLSLLANTDIPTPTRKLEEDDVTPDAGIPWTSPPAPVAATAPISTYSTGLLLGLLYFAYYLADALLRAATVTARRKRSSILLKPAAKLLSNLETPAVVGSLYLAFCNALAPAGHLGTLLDAVRWIATGPWAIYLVLLGPVFSLLEAGVAVILSQLTGQRSRELVHNGNDALGYLFVTFCLAIYYYVTRTTYNVLKIADLTVPEGCLAVLLIMGMLALAIFALCTSKGTIVDASLVLAYVVYNIRHATLRATAAGSEEQSEARQLSFLFAESMQVFLRSLDVQFASGAAGHLFDAVKASLGTEALFALAFRVAIFLIFVKVLPTLLARRSRNQHGQGTEVKEAVEKLVSLDTEKDEAPSAVPSILSKARIFAMPVVLAYYTQSLFTYYAQEQFIDPHVWRWAAAMVAVALYGSEMTIRGSDDFGGGMCLKEE